jgi:streptomycin 6-kinase
MFGFQAFPSAVATRGPRQRAEARDVLVNNLLRIVAADVMTMLHHYLARWSLVADGAPFETPSSHLVYVQSSEGPAVLKLFKPPREEARSPLGLLHYSGSGAVRVIAYDQEAMLTRRALPGRPLSDLVRAGRDDAAIDVVCDVAAALHARGAASGDWTTVEDWGTDWAGADRLPRGLVDEAQRTFSDLCRRQSNRVLLHGDLHHDNILLDSRLGWLSIDPKCVVGEREYELGAVLRNPAGMSDVYAEPAVMRRRVRRMCARFGFKIDRVLRWSFAQAVLSAVWCVQDGRGEADIAAAVKVAQVSRALARESS